MRCNGAAVGLTSRWCRPPLMPSPTLATLTAAAHRPVVGRTAVRTHDRKLVKQRRSGTVKWICKIHTIRHLVAWTSFVPVLLPVGAGGFRVGDREGPLFYPSEIHAFLCRVGWELMGDTEGSGKPRINFCRRWNWRPLFYGLPSKNERVQYWMPRVVAPDAIDLRRRCSLAMMMVDREF